MVAGVLALTPSAASAACPDGAQCASVTVPLDHSGATAGTLSLAYAKVPASGTRVGTIVFLSGGPGQAAIPLTKSVADVLGPLSSSYDLVTVDQRGTGDSGAVDCDVERVEDAEACANALGAKRPFWNTPETAKDLEDLRVALGVDKLTLLGVSYGAKVAARVRAPLPGLDRGADPRLPRARRRARRLRPAAYAGDPARARRGLLPGPLRARPCATRTPR